MSKLGSYDWSKKRGGFLSPHDRFVFFASAVKSRFQRLLCKRRRDLPYERLDLEALSFPSSRLIENAFAIGHAAYEPWLLNHCLRTYLWGGLVGQLEAVQIDLEALLVTALFHDLGLTQYAKDGSECFAVRGACAADAVLSDTPLEHTAAAGIAMHLNIAVPPSEPPLNYLLHQGAAIDVVGWDIYKVQPLVDAVLPLHPRLDFKNKFGATLAAEAAAHPHARLEMMIRFGFLDFIKRAPYAE